MKRRILILIAAICLAPGCATTRTYKITFKNGDVDYYNLDYKPKKDAKSIEYEGETILGIEKIEAIP